MFISNVMNVHLERYETTKWIVSPDFHGYPGRYVKLFAAMLHDHMQHFNMTTLWLSSQPKSASIKKDK